MQTVYFILYCHFTVYNEHTLVNNYYSPSFNLIPRFIYTQVAFPSDNRQKFYTSLVCVFSLMMAQKGSKHVGCNKNIEWLITADGPCMHFVGLINDSMTQFPLFGLCPLSKIFF